VRFPLQIFDSFGETVYGIIRKAVKNGPSILVTLADEAVHEDFPVFDTCKESVFDEILSFEAYFAVYGFIDLARMVKIRLYPLCFLENMQLPALHADFAGNFTVDIALVDAAQKPFESSVIYVYQIRIAVHSV
jgi:hypothetical protein